MFNHQIEIRDLILPPQQKIAHNATHHIERHILLLKGYKQRLKGWMLWLPIHGAIIPEVGQMV